MTSNIIMHKKTNTNRKIQCLSPSTNRIRRIWTTKSEFDDSDFSWLHHIPKTCTSYFSRQEWHPARVFGMVQKKSHLLYMSQPLERYLQSYLKLGCMQCWCWCWWLHWSRCYWCSNAGMCTHFCSAVCADIEFYKRAVAFVMSYSFAERMNDTSRADIEICADSEECKGAPMMVPIADILNHVADNNAKLIFGIDSLKMVATRPINEVCFISMYNCQAVMSFVLKLS